MQDDCYLIAEVGWIEGAKPREIVQVKNKEKKLVWRETEDFRQGKRRFKCDLVPVTVLTARTFKVESEAITSLEAELAGVDQQLEETREEQSGEDGLLNSVIEGEGEKQKITAKALKARLKEIGKDIEYAEEREALLAYSKLLDQQAETKTRLKTAQDDLEAKVASQYSALKLADIQTLVVHDKWLATLAASVQGELDRVSQTLTGRIRVLAERYAKRLPELESDVEALSAKVEAHLKQMGFCRDY